MQSYSISYQEPEGQGLANKLRRFAAKVKLQISESPRSRDKHIGKRQRVHAESMAARGIGPQQVLAQDTLERVQLRMHP